MRCRFGRGRLAAGFLAATAGLAGTLAAGFFPAGLAGAFAGTEARAFACTLAGGLLTGFSSPQKNTSIEPASLAAKRPAFRARFVWPGGL